MREPAVRRDSTLQELRDAFVDALVFQCRRCSHRSALPIGDLIDRYGSRLPHGDILRRAYCSQCSARIFDVMPMGSWHKRHLSRR